ncbi:MAG: diguanylate cyclase, partial [Leptospiraceae bacterium]|nr:diguanylate cyclase [Leptospiraceae bacterium]
VCRTGGEEFSVILPETEIEAAYKACFRFSEILKHSSSLKLKRTITISGGISTFPDDSILAEELYVRADELAYISKKSGKDKISI